MTERSDFLADLDSCPECDAQWGYVQNDKRYSYIIGVIEHDRCVRWRCPACGTEWLRGALVGDAPRASRTPAEESPAQTNATEEK